MADKRIKGTPRFMEPSSFRLMHFLNYKERILKRKEKSLDFFFDFYYSSFERDLWRQLMTVVLECPLCEADIPLDGDEKPGELIVCSYCQTTYKMLRKKGEWILAEDFEE
jgi:hypothetical protein